MTIDTASNESITCEGATKANGQTATNAKLNARSIFHSVA
jgi:hypothetical protein